MSRTSLLKFAYLSFLSNPKHNRGVYRAIRRLKVRSIVELGVGTGTRADRMIAVAGRYHDCDEIQYTGIDLFEAHPEKGTSLSLKAAHRVLRATGAQIRLIPGDPLSALSRSANTLQSTDLLVIGADQDARSLEQAWFYVPRMLHEKSIVLVEERDLRGDAKFRELTEGDAERLAASTASTRRAA